MSHPLIRVTIYGSLLCYLVALICWVSRQRGQAYRVSWSIGCVLMWGHALAAFHFYHNWSHADAVELTARETQAILGEPFGNGIWFSYALLVVWAIDSVFCWIPKINAATWRFWFGVLVHLYAFFILFNGTVIFEEGPIRWAGVIGTIWAIRMAWRFRSFRISNPRVSG